MCHKKKDFPDIYLGHISPEFDLVITIPLNVDTNCSELPSRMMSLNEEHFIPDYNEELPSKRRKINPKRLQASQLCPLCGTVVDKLRRHALLKHLPFFIVPHTACWQCGTQHFSTLSLQKHFDAFHCNQGSFEEDYLVWSEAMKKLFQSLMSCLHIDTLDNLVNYINENRILPQATTFSNDTDISLLKNFANQNGLTEVSQFSIHPINSVAALCHWRVLLSILQQVTPAVLHGIWNLCPDNFCPPVIDSHFHLDQLRSELHQNHLTLEEALALTEHQYNMPFAISNYVYPQKWPRELKQEMNVKLSFGVHPHMVSFLNDSHWDQLTQLLKTPDVVAIGECGLDYSSSPSSTVVATQKYVFIKQIHMASTLQLPLVIHCRDQHGRDKASQDALEILKQNLDRSHPVHRHCFSSSITEKDNWLLAFPNTMFGFTSTLLHPGRHPTLDQVVCDLPDDKILIESDAPYLPPHEFTAPLRRNWTSGRRVVGTPGMLYPVVDRIARLKGLSANHVFLYSKANAMNFYRLN